MTASSTGPRRPVRERENPFRIGGIVGGEFFTNRARERKRIRQALMTAQDHLLVFGPRRMGKTSTLNVVAEELTKLGKHVVLADLSTASALSDLTNRILQSATRALGRRWKDAALSLVQHFSVKVGLTPDLATGAMIPTVDVSIRDADHATQRQGFGEALDAIEQLATSKRTHVGVVLDEFQEIHRFGGVDAEAHLRSIIQRHTHVSYVLAGSDERLIRAMTGARRPFYKLFEPLEFGPMDPDHLARWIESRLASASIRPSNAGSMIVALAGPRTRDVVQLARATFEVSRASGAAGMSEIDEAFRQIVLAEDAPIRALWESLSPLQQNALRAVAVRTEGLTTKVARRQFGLGETGPATKAMQTLVSRDLLVKTSSGYRYDSPFMRGWVIANTLPDVGLSLPLTHLP